MAESLPSFSSHSWKPFLNFRWKKREYQTITGSGAMAISVRSTSMPSMKTTDITSMIMIRIRLVICSDIKFRVVSMSLVQRWIISPVWFCICHWKGSRSIWQYSVSRMFLTSVSPPRALVTRNPYCAATLTRATAITASARIHKRSRRAEGPPKASSSPRTAGLRLSAGAFPTILSTVTRIICGVTMSASAESAAHSIQIMKKALLPFRN